MSKETKDNKKESSETIQEISYMQYVSVYKDKYQGFWQNKIKLEDLRKRIEKAEKDIKRDKSK